MSGVRVPDGAPRRILLFFFPAERSLHSVAQDRWPYGQQLWPVGQVVKTKASHALIGSSTLPRVTTSRHAVPVVLPIDKEISAKAPLNGGRSFSPQSFALRGAPRASHEARPASLAQWYTRRSGRASANRRRRLLRRGRACKRKIPKGQYN